MERVTNILKAEMSIEINPIFEWVEEYTHYVDDEGEMYFYLPAEALAKVGHVDLPITIGIGSSSWITNASGNVDQHLAYMPFGVLRSEAQQSRTPFYYQNTSEQYFINERSNRDIRFKFTGKERDSETGYQFPIAIGIGARYYDSDISVWLSVDPIIKANESPYLYCAGNPVMLIDPNGMDWIDKDGNKLSDEERKNVKVFIFFEPGGSDVDGFEEQAMKQYDYYVEKYGEGSVALSNAKNNEDFLQDWKDISGEDTRLVILDYHGDSQWIGLPDGNLSSVGDKTAELKNNALDINKLPMPSGNISKAKLQINSCHSNESTSEGKNVVQAFKDNFFKTSKGFKYIRGASGSVSYPFGGVSPFSYWTWSTYRRPSFNSASQIDWDAINDFPW